MITPVLCAAEEDGSVVPTEQPETFSTQEPASEPVDSPSPTLSSEPANEPTPQPIEIFSPIEVREYSAKVLGATASARIYLLECTTPDLPRVGKVLLLKKETDPVAALRVLRQYPAGSRIAATVVKWYGAALSLENDANYRVLEKRRNSSVIPPPPLTETEKSDVKELEVQENLKYDPELDVEGSQPPTGAVESVRAGEEPSQAPAFDSDEDEDREFKELVVDEIFPLEVNDQAVSAQFGYFRNLNADGGAGYSAGGGVRWTWVTSKLLWLKQPQIQDSISVEAGLALYKILNYADAGDAFTVVPFTAIGRYNILLGESLGAFAYAGLVKNTVTSAISSEDTVPSIALLDNFAPALGIGLNFRVGPNWDARFDLGLDMIGAGIMLKF